MLEEERTNQQPSSIQSWKSEVRGEKGLLYACLAWKGREERPLLSLGIVCNLYESLLLCVDLKIWWLKGDYQKICDWIRVCIVLFMSMWFYFIVRILKLWTLHLNLMKVMIKLYVKSLWSWFNMCTIICLIVMRLLCDVQFMVWCIWIL